MTILLYITLYIHRLLVESRNPEVSFCCLLLTVILNETYLNEHQSNNSSKMCRVKKFVESLFPNEMRVLKVVFIPLKGNHNSDPCSSPLR